MLGDAVDCIVVLLECDPCIRDVFEMSKAPAAVQIGHAVVISEPPHGVGDLRGFLRRVVRAALHGGTVSRDHSGDLCGVEGLAQSSSLMNS